MKKYAEMSKQELEDEIVQLKAQYKKFQEMDLNLNMARGKPCREQLDLSMGLMDALNSEADLSCEDGTDCRNYGGVEFYSKLISLDLNLHNQRLQSESKGECFLFYENY